MKHILNWVKKDFISRLNSKKSKFKGVRVAFTLAEVLITLGIIGVVAALTMPTLIQNHQKQVYVTGLKKAYSNIQNMFSKMAFDEGVTDWSNLYCYQSSSSLIGCSGDAQTFERECSKHLEKQFNIVEKKLYGENCSSDWCKTASKLAYINSTSEHQQSLFLTPDSMIYLFNCVSRIITVDVNGTKGPNQWGRDIFAFHVRYDENKILPSGISGSSVYCTTEAVNNASYNARYCAGKVIREGKMDY